MREAGTDQPPLGELLCGKGVQFSIVPGWVAELPLSVLPAGAFRLYSLYCAHANGANGKVWLHEEKESLRETARKYLGCSERAQRKWEKQLEGLGLISKIGFYGIRVHRRRDDVNEVLRLNAVLALKSTRHARAGLEGLPAAPKPARACRSDNGNRHGRAAEPALACRYIQRSEITTSDSRTDTENEAAQEVESKSLGKETDAEREQKWRLMREVIERVKAGLDPVE